MKHPTEVFDEWAIIGKDKGMEASHSASVSEIWFTTHQIDKSTPEIKAIKNTRNDFLNVFFFFNNF